jgi:hypothetical protein
MQLAHQNATLINITQNWRNEMTERQYSIVTCLTDGRQFTDCGYCTCEQVINAAKERLRYETAKSYVNAFVIVAPGAESTRLVPDRQFYLSFIGSDPLIQSWHRQDAAFYGKEAS